MASPWLEPGDEACVLLGEGPEAALRGWFPPGPGRLSTYSLPAPFAGGTMGVTAAPAIGANVRTATRQPTDTTTLVSLRRTVIPRCTHTALTRVIISKGSRRRTGICLCL